MKARIRYFGRFAIEIGKFSEELEVPENTTVREFLEILREKYPKLKDETIEVSIGGKYAREEDKIGDEISIYPPISGG